MAEFDPSGPGKRGSLFGLPHTIEQADLVILPVPWDVTVSYKSGTARGPQAILDASPQIDYNIPGVLNPWIYQVAMEEVNQQLFDKGSELRSKAQLYIDWLEGDKEEEKNWSTILNLINQEHELLNQWVYHESNKYLKKGKVVGVLGGEHSTPLGLINAISQSSSFGILQIDAHMDLRDSYEGFEFSHASIMFNALQNNQVSNLVQVGIRDYCQAELVKVKDSKERIVTFFDQQLKEERYEGKNWTDQVNEIINHLPENVYISFDIDGLDPKLCPSTGTPVPGGLLFEEASFLIKSLVKSGRRIVGFDLCEVAPGNNDWDANVGARVLYILSVYTGISNGKLKFDYA